MLQDRPPSDEKLLFPPFFRSGNVMKQHLVHTIFTSACSRINPLPSFFLFKKKYGRSRKTAWNFLCVVLQFYYFQKCSQQYTLYTVQYYLWCHSPSVRFLVLYRLARLGFIMSAITIMVCIPWTFKWWLRIYQHLENGIIKNIVLCIVYTEALYCHLVVKRNMSDQEKQLEILHV